MSVDAPLNTIVSLLKGMYSCHSNSDRRQLTLNLLSFEEGLDGRTLSVAGVGLLGLATEGVAVQAYGAVMLKNALRARKIGIADVPLWDLFTWYCSEPSMSELLSEDMRKLLVECVYVADENIVPRMLDTLLAGGDLSRDVRRLFLLQGIVTGCMEPDFDHVDRAKVGPLKRSITGRGECLLAAMTTTLFSLFTAAGGQGSTALPLGMEPLLEASFATLAAVAPAVSFEVLVQVSLGETIGALLRWQPSQRMAVVAAAALIRTADGLQAERQRMMQTQLTSVLECLASCVAARDIGLVDEVLTLLKEVPKALVASVSSTVCQCLVHILTIPSIWFAEQVCSILLGVEDTHALKEVNPLSLYGSLRRLVVKHQYDPEKGTNAEGVALSQEQLGFAHLYRQTFDSFRSLGGKLMGRVAHLHPRETNYFVLGLLSELCDSAGMAADERTRRGYVTQRSLTFLLWEATAFLVDQLTEAFRVCPDYVAECITALQQRQPTDAVLVPLYLNMLSCFWRCGPFAASLNVWSGTLDILFKYIDDTKTASLPDADEEAAQRRAHTLLVTVCSDHAADIDTAVAMDCMARIKTLLFSAKGQHRSFLYECVAALVASLSPIDAAVEFGVLVDPVLAVVRDAALPLTQPQFNEIIMGNTLQSRDERNTLRSSIDVLSAVFRRSQPAPYVVERLNSLVPVLSHIVALLHGVNAAALPPAFRRILEQSESEKHQFMPGNTRQSDANERKTPCDLARTALLNIRTAVYQLIGAVCGLVPTEHLAGLLQGMLFNTETSMPIHHVRMLTQKCLLPVGDHHPQLLAPILSLLTSFFAQHTTEVQQQQHQQPQKSRDAQRKSNDGIVSDKQWFYFTKDVLNYVRSHVLDNALWQQTPALLPQLASLAITVLESGCDPRNANHFSMGIMDLKAPIEGPAAAAGLAEALFAAQKEVYVCLLRNALSEVRNGVRNHPLPKEVDSMVYSVSGPYIRFIPHFSGCLEAVGVPTDWVEKLHAQLVMSNSENTQRRKVKELLIQFATSLK